jgi:uncharacterized protein (TIGR00251 family)
MNYELRTTNCVTIGQRPTKKLMDNLKIEQKENGVVFAVKVVPASSRTGIGGLLGGMLKVKVAAPPEKGKANKCLVEFLAKQLGVKKNQISIISGQTNPVKTIQAAGISIEALLEKLET